MAFLFPQAVRMRAYVMSGYDVYCVCLPEKKCAALQF